MASKAPAVPEKAQRTLHELTAGDMIDADGVETLSAQGIDPRSLDLQAAIEAWGGEVEEFDDGTEIVQDKHHLVGVPFFIVEYRFNEGGKGPRGFVSIVAKLISPPHTTVVINDGGTGIMSQLMAREDAITARGQVVRRGGIHVPGGLTVSHYTNENTGPEGADTFYLATSKVYSPA